MTFFTIFVGAICPYLVDPPYGKVNQRGNTPSSVAYYSCNYGYVLYGLRHRQCLYDGTWYGVAPECRPVVKSKWHHHDLSVTSFDDHSYSHYCLEPTCPPLDKPRNGQIRVYGYMPQSKAYYSCNYGYKLDGLQWRKCLPDGTWYGSAPTCHPIRY